MHRSIHLMLVLGCVLSAPAWSAEAEADARRGAALWAEPHAAADGTVRQCADCHTADLTRPGRHVKTLKPIEPLAPSVNPKRLSDTASIAKWLHRNCRWTLGRECTAQEQADLLAYIRTQ